MVDIRIINTKSQLKAALFECLKEKSLREVKIKDIISVSGVSTRTFYQYYSDVDNLIEEIEKEFIEGYRKSIEKDRDVILDVDYSLPIEKQFETVLNSAKNTIAFCFERKEEIQTLLSDNGDIRFYNLIYKTSCDEFLKRATTMKSTSDIKLSSKQRLLFDINVQVFVHCMIDLVSVLLKYDDRLSPYDVRQSIFDFLHKTPLDRINEIIQDN